MRISKFLILFISLTFTELFCHAQNPGYGGKKVFFEIKAINGLEGVAKGLNINYTLSRKKSIGLGFNYSTSKCAQIYKKEEYLVTDNGEKRLPERAKVTTASLNVNFKYFLNSMVKLPCPAGTYLFADLEAGYINISGSYYKSLLNYAGPGQDEIIHYTYNGLPFGSLQLGIGYNRFLLPWLTVGMSLSVQDNYYFPSLDAGSIPDRASMGVKKSYGTNLLGFSRIGDGDPTPGFDGTYKLKSPQSNYIGLSCFVTVGLILF